METLPLKHTEIMEIWPEIVVSCYGEKITVKRAEYDCPPVPFILPATLSWTTPTYNYSANVVELELNTSWPGLEKMINKAHFRVPPLVRTVEAIDKVEQLRKELLETKLDMSVGLGSYQMSYKHSSIGLSAIVIFSFIVFICTLMIRGKKAMVAIEKLQAEQKAQATRFQKHQFTKAIYATPRPTAITWRQ